MKTPNYVHGGFALAFALLATTLHAAERPNIVYLMADDLCTYAVGCYGNKDVRTPNMDQLGRDGVIFYRHYNTTSICMASRASVMFHLTKDPLEMTNLVSHPEASSMLEAMRKKYDAELDKWKSDGVAVNDYQKYVTLFDRSIPLDPKQIGKRASENKTPKPTEEEKTERKNKKAERAKN